MSGKVGFAVLEIVAESETGVVSLDFLVAGGFAVLEIVAKAG